MQPEQAQGTIWNRCEVRDGGRTQKGKLVNEEAPIVHLYGQSRPRDKAFIVGTFEGLLQLREAINQALRQPSGLIHATSAFVSDGEGYTLSVICAADERMHDYIIPYVWERTDYIVEETTREACPQATTE